MDKKEVHDKLTLLWRMPAVKHSDKIKEASWIELRSRIAAFSGQKPEIKEKTVLKWCSALWRIIMRRRKKI